MRAFFKVHLRLVITVWVILLSNVVVAANKTVFMTVWRGCEEACQGFQDYMKKSATNVQVIVRDANRDRSKLSGFLEEAKSLNPDLVVTWGTTVSKAVIGTREEYGTATKLGAIPVLFMIVADPVGADISATSSKTGRPTVAGIRNRIEEEVQINAMREYLRVNKIGVVYSTAELNSVLNTEKLRSLSQSMNFDLIEFTYELDSQGKPLPGQFEQAMATMSAQGVDVVYVGSSSYNLANSDAFTEAALRFNLPVASAYGSMVTNSSALISVSKKYYRVGQLAANQAKKILFDNSVPGDLPIAELSGYSMAINMGVARELGVYPPIQLLRFADLVNIQSDSTK